MITLERDGKRMEVATELQASVFMRSGYVKVDKSAKVETPVADEPKETAEQAAETEKPKRRRRSQKTE